MSEQIAFLDEWGNNGLNFASKGVSTHFIVTALTLPKSSLTEAEAQIEQVRSKYFQSGAMKSSKVGNNDARRQLILKELLKAPFQILAIIVDKRLLVGEGFRHKGSFYKFMHSLADRELFRTFPNLDLVADQHGSESFMEGFIRYVHDTHVPNLFNQVSFGFVSDTSSVLIQTADFIAGTLARCYDETVRSAQANAFIHVLKPKISFIRYWPEPFSSYTTSLAEQSETYNKELAELSMNLAQDFINRHTRIGSPQHQDQLSCLHYLVLYFRTIHADKYVSSRELIQHIEGQRGSSISLHYFQARVIAPLRDAGVLIASSSKGYKLPASEQDLYSFINHSNTIIQPMLSRIKKCRDRILLATNGKLDLLEAEVYQSLRSVLQETPISSEESSQRS